MYMELTRGSLTLSGTQALVIILIVPPTGELGTFLSTIASDVARAIRQQIASRSTQPAQQVQWVGVGII